MSILDLGKACTFSEMNLEITYKGEPASGAKIWRRIKWQSENIDEFEVDETGKVALPEVLQRSITQLLPSEFAVSQAIIVKYKNEEFKVWINSKRSPDKNSELGGADINLKCELTKKPELVEEFDTLLLTSCEWSQD